MSSSVPTQCFRGQAKKSTTHQPPGQNNKTATTTTIMFEKLKNFDLTEFSRRASESAAASIRSLSTEEVAKKRPNDTASITNSTISSGLSLSRQGSVRRTVHIVRGGFLPSVAEDDSVSVLTYDPYSDNNRPSPEELLRCKDEELKQLEHAHQTTKTRLGATTEELTKLQLKHRTEHREYQLTIEELQSQKIVLQERIDVMQEQLHSEELSTHIKTLIEEEAPQLEETPEDPLENGGSLHGGLKKNGFKLPFGHKEKENNNNHHKKLQAEKDEYIAKLQSRLTEANKNMHIMSNQMTLMEDTLAEQVQKLRRQLKESEQRRLEQEVKYLSQLDQAELEKKTETQTLLAKLETKEDRISRLEDLLDEIRDLAESKNAGRFGMEDFAAVVALDALKEQYDKLSKEKDKLTVQYHGRLDEMGQELARLQHANEHKQRVIDRLETSDGLAALEHDTLTAGAISEYTATDDDNDDDDNDTGNKDSDDNTNDNTDDDDDDDNSFIGTVDLERSFRSSKTAPPAPPRASPPIKAFQHQKRSLSPTALSMLGRSSSLRSLGSRSGSTRSLSTSSHHKRPVRRYRRRHPEEKTEQPQPQPPQVDDDTVLESGDELPDELRASMRNLVESINKISDEMDDEKSADGLDDIFQRQALDHHLGFASTQQQQQQQQPQGFDKRNFRRKSFQAQQLRYIGMDDQSRKKQENRLSRFL